MNLDRQNSSPLSASRIFAALLVLLSVSLSLTSEVFADHYIDSCCSESNESNEGDKGNEDGDCNTCLCCLPVIKVLVPADFDADISRGPISVVHRSGTPTNSGAPPAEIDHPPQNLQ